MSRLLLIASDPERADRLGGALRRQGFSVEVAPEGFYALTLIERQRPPLLLVDGAGGDLPAGELAAIVRSDPALASLVLVVAVRSGESVPEGFDRVVDGDLPPDRLAAALHGTALEERAVSDCTLRGSLDTLDLPQLAGALGQGRRTGRLSLDLPGERSGEIYFDRGVVVHVRFRGGEGRAAFTELFAATLWSSDVSFRFEVLTREDLFRCPRSLGIGVPELLLSTAIDLDEIRNGGGDRERVG